jgi:hypothetical protein
MIEMRRKLGEVKQNSKAFDKDGAVDTAGRAFSFF